MFSSLSPSLLLLSLPFLLHLSHSSSAPKRLPERFLGKFELAEPYYDSRTSFDVFLSELGVGWLMRQIAWSLYPHLIINQNKEGLVTARIEASIFVFDVEFLLDSDDAEFDVNEGKLIFNYKGEKMIRSVAEVTQDGKRLTLAMTIKEARHTLTAYSKRIN